MPASITWNAALMSLALGTIASACAGRQSEEVSRVPTPAENLSGNLERKMENCPSTVPGARSRAEVIDRGVVLIVTGPGAAEREIRERAMFHATQVPGVGRVHSGRGTGGGRIGFCPIVHPGTDLSVESIPGGARIKMQATASDEVAQLRTTVSNRVRELTEVQARLQPR